MRMSELNIIHPGPVISKTDGDHHYVGYRQLIRLYNLDPSTCERWEEHREYSLVSVHYFARYDGDYPIFQR